MTTQRRAVGAYGERVAAQHLMDLGYVILARNWRCADGELDLVLRDGDDLVICEVKTRLNSNFGPPAEAITPSKVRKIRRLARRWLDESGLSHREIRFDVVEVLPQQRGATQIQHLRAAF
ncbi:YraN family protein [Actinoplanes sp. NPDC049596]|uniref:YraN family protein n=1 Tax=unclassified Actinoplanes TaxID=2626549 RepID=UPI003447C38C